MRIETSVPVAGFGSSRYRVTREGVVVSRGRLFDRVLVPFSKKPYLIVRFYEGGQQQFRKVHRIVLETFTGPCPEGFETRHLNGIPTDNRLANLAWGTRADNIYDGVFHTVRPGQLRYPIGDHA